MTTITKHQFHYLRILGALCVVSIHTSAYMWDKMNPATLSHDLIVAINAFCRFAVPLFLTISAYGLYLAYYDRPLRLKDFYTKRLQSALIPYLVWTLVYFLWNNLYKGRPYGARDLYYYITLGKTTYHLYFMSIIIQFYLVFPLMMWVLKKDRLRYPFIILLALYSLFDFYFVKLTYGASYFFTYAVFFAIGFFLADWHRQGKKLPKWFQYGISLMAGLSMIYYVINSYFVKVGHSLFIAQAFNLSWWLYSISFIILLFMVLQRLPLNRPNPLVATISHHTFTIYLAHPLMMYFLREVVDYVGFAKAQPFEAFVIQTLYALIASLFLGLLLSKIKQIGQSLFER